MILAAHQAGASDLHLEPGFPAATRVRGTLRASGPPIPAQTLHDYARELIGAELWPQFVERRSFDLSSTIQGARCRINILQTSRGTGFAIRLFSSFEATVEKLNLHPDIKKLVARTHGLILISGPTGSGKSSTLAALIQEINLAEARHIITVESPIEYTFTPRRSFIRQREVGRDTPGFEQALLDALREDPDVLMVGEMRDPETMRLTLNVAETGHLVLATVHSSTAIEALQRIVSAFPPEIQSPVAAQLADSLVGVVAQQLRFRPELNILLPECEILQPTHAIKNFIRNREFHKIISVQETGASQGLWTFARYRAWMDGRTNWYIPGKSPEPEEPAVMETTAPALAAARLPAMPPPAARPAAKAAAPKRPTPSASGRIEIQPVEGGLPELLKKLE